jgi:hypothetical protein
MQCSVSQAIATGWNAVYVGDTQFYFSVTTNVQRRWVLFPKDSSFLCRRYGYDTAFSHRADLLLIVSYLSYGLFQAHWRTFLSQWR